MVLITATGRLTWNGHIQPSIEPAIVIVLYKIFHSTSSARSTTATGDSKLIFTFSVFPDVLLVEWQSSDFVHHSWHSLPVLKNMICNFYGDGGAFWITGGKE